MASGVDLIWRAWSWDSNR